MNLDQSRAALVEANRTRRRRSTVRRKLAASPPLAAVDTALEILGATPEPLLATMPVRRLLEALPRYGPDRLAKVFRSAEGVPDHTPLGSLTDRQRTALAGAVWRWRPYQDSRAKEAA